MVSNRASGGPYSSPYSTLIHITDLLAYTLFPETEGMQVIWEFWKNFRKICMSKERLQTEGMQVI